MPSGYTADVASGKMTDFAEYALQCARAFGALIMLRDEPLSSEIPTFTPNTYDEEAIQQKSKELSEFLAMTEDQRRQAHADDQAARKAESEKWIAERKLTRQRYEAMLQKARQFKSPSPDHDNYAKFLVEQLEQSIKFDCSTDYYDRMSEPVPFEKWEQDRLNRLSDDISYHMKQRDDEIARTKERNNWVRQLREALSPGDSK